MAMVAGGLFTVRASHEDAIVRHFRFGRPERIVRHVFFSQVYDAVGNRLFAPFNRETIQPFLGILSFQFLTNPVIKGGSVLHWMRTRHY
jgi:hypothetical protein